MALALGARVFEKHLTFDRSEVGPDHRASSTPWEFRHYIRTLNDCERAMGDGKKRVLDCEKKNRERYEAFIKPRLEQC